LGILPDQTFAAGMDGQIGPFLQHAPNSPTFPVVQASASLYCLPMLSTLRVKNLAIVDNIRVDLQEGLNVITGETGAGKSILADALGLVLGDRADRSMIRAGEAQCGVEACFELSDPSEINSVLDEMGLEACDGNTLIVRRLISSSGAGKNLVNDCPTTVQTLKRIGTLLVDMHGPHDHQSLLDPDFQLDILDAYGHLADARSAYGTAYRALLDLQQQRSALDGDDHAVEQQIDMLSFQVRELEDADLKDLDEEALQHEHTRVANASRIIELTDAVRNALIEEDTSAFNALAFAQRTLPELADLIEEGAEWRVEVESMAVQIQELSNTMAGFVQSIDADPERLVWIEDRMGLLQKLKRKYGNTVSEMLAFLEKAKTTLTELETRGQRLTSIDADIAKAEKQATKLGEALRKARKKAATTLGKAITKHLHDLGFPHGEFEVAVAPAETFRPSGLDDIDFGFAPNVGEPMRSLKAIASSGEISRVMLAVKAVLAKHDRIPVLVFDEIDSNVGGEMGNAIGAKLTTVAEQHQVICITHLPQVAVHGAAHFVVAKEVHEGRTRTSIQPVSEEARAEEVARMLGGKDLTSVTLTHAREMLRLDPA
jgi:DNA repair protein RecN (Recombination protein N)